MNSSASKPTKSKSYYQIATTIFFSLLLLTACQKTPEPADDRQTDTQTQTTIAIDVADAAESDNNESPDNTIGLAESKTNAERDISLTQLENDLGTTVTIPNHAATAPNPEQAIKGAQITDVSYRSATGETLSVVFETSAAGTLNAIVTLPNKPKMTLSAPEGQGNNPTYRSSDGTIQLVSHGGGSTVDLIQHNKVSSFDAISAEAEVIPE